ncbi:uncharacterized protein B0H18DRAFT_963087 [Fomitopsis serialis]|nr:uncharacterized protein B0H18DRAFT_963087 [Neoantrodia serialis]KAH9910596.1 hypothetical protein B0H18DRAFT_963087 [Neoantrodia serialis]
MDERSIVLEETEAAASGLSNGPPEVAAAEPIAQPHSPTPTVSEMAPLGARVESASPPESTKDLGRKPPSRKRNKPDIDNPASSSKPPSKRRRTSPVEAPTDGGRQSSRLKAGGPQLREKQRAKTLEAAGRA